MARTPGLTVCMIVRDERDNLEILLPGVVDAADDVVIVDTGSKDDTREVAKRLGARVFERPWDDNFAAARNRSLEEARTSHVLWLDADDRISAEDIRTIRETALKRGDVALMTLLVNEAADPSAVSSCWQLRVFPARDEHRFKGRIHEQINDALVSTGTRIERVDVTITHTGYADTETMIRKARRNFELLRREMNEGGDDDINVLYHYIKAATRIGELDEALRVARRCVEAPPKGTPLELVQSAAVQLGRLLAQCGHPDEALETLRKAVDLKPDDALTRFFLGDLLRRRGDLQGALREFEAARLSPIECGTLPVPVAGLNRAIRLQLGEILEVLGRPADAAPIYREAFNDHPEDGNLGRALARALLASGASPDAARVLDQLPPDPASERETTLLRASIAFNAGDLDTAETLFSGVEQDHPRTWAAALHLGHIHLRRMDLKEALAAYQRAVAVADNPETRVGLAAAQLEIGRLTECLDNLAECVDQCQNRPLPMGTEALSGEALLRFGRPQEAIGAFENHLKRCGPDGRIVARLADCYREMGADQAARVGYEEALRLSPGLSDALLGLDALQTVQ